MKIFKLSILMLALVATAALLYGATTVPIVVSPNVLNLDSQGVWVTVHAEIPYSIVEGASVTLNGIPVDATFADSRGDLVAKFIIEKVKDYVTSGCDVPGDVTLTLTGDSTEGPFSGTDTIQVIAPRR